MTLLCEAVKDGAIGVISADTRDALSAIHRSDCAAAIWRRQMDPRVRDWIEELAPSALPGTRQIVRPEAVRDAIFTVCDAAGTTEGAERDWLVDDIVSLAAQFADIAGAPYLRLRLDVVTTNACRKFHIDAVTSRLICTYRGTGTQYGTLTNGSEPAPIFTAPTGAPIILRGTLWPETPASGLRHRSPPPSPEPAKRASCSCLTQSMTLMKKATEER